ncbi:MAG: PAAR domain-containing protein [Planctomycetes bacterium]|nr:PAAR domain-containing protein [Planctomycetota bacterium]
MTAIAGTNDIHICPVPSGPAPHGPGVVTRGSSTVLINSLPAARQGDKVYEAAGGSDPIAMGCGTVVIG